MSDADDIEGLAAEYVLGTLDRDERAMVAARRTGNGALDAAIAAWERRLGPLVELVAPVTPPPNLYSKIRAQIGLASNVVSLRARERDLTRRAGRWRSTALGASALAAALAGVIGWREYQHQRELQTLPTQYVAVLQTSEAQPAFLLTIDTKTHRCVITAVSAPKKPDKSYEVWLVNDKLPSPKSLGTYAEGDMSVMPMDDGADSALFMNASYAVSLEPEGGSPTGAPTGPVLFSGKLVQATP